MEGLRNTMVIPLHTLATIICDVDTFGPLLFNIASFGYNTFYILEIFVYSLILITIILSTTWKLLPIL